MTPVLFKQALYLFQYFHSNMAEHNGEYCLQMPQSKKSPLLNFLFKKYQKLQKAVQCLINLKTENNQWTIKRTLSLIKRGLI